jgi:hypothetical protein
MAKGNSNLTLWSGCRLSHRLAPRVDVHMEDWTTIHGWIDGVKQALPSLTLSPTR